MKEEVISSPISKSIFKSLVKNKSLFFTHYKYKGFIAYRETSKALVVATEPLARSLSEQVVVFESLMEEKNSYTKRVSGYYFSKNFAEILKSKHRYSVYKIGESFFSDLSSFSLSGHKRRDLRRALNYSEKENFEVVELDKKTKEVYFSEILLLEKLWLKSRKSFKLLGRIGFILTRVTKDYQFKDEERWFILKDKKEVVAFVSLVPMRLSNNFESSYYLDNMIYKPKYKKFLMDSLLINVLKSLKLEAVKEVYFGLSPFSFIEPNNGLEYCFYWINKLGLIYSSNGLMHFKEKYCNRRESRYLVIKDKKKLIFCLLDLFSVTYPKFSKNWYKESFW